MSVVLVSAISSSENFWQDWRSLHCRRAIYSKLSTVSLGKLLSFVDLTALDLEWPLHVLLIDVNCAAAGETFGLEIEVCKTPAQTGQGDLAPPPQR